MQYSKPTLSIAEQISRLSYRGLTITDISFAENKLQHISYYRLRAYTYPFQDNANPDHPFIHSVSFEKIISFYEFDRDLRLLVFDAIERIEVALRSLIVYHFALTYGSHWYENASLYRNNIHFINDIAALDKEVNRSDEAFIKHYKNKYTNPVRPPAWMSLEVVTFTTLSKFYQNLNLTPEKKAVARHCGLHPFVLENWMHVISDIRNICAHHSRLYNRSLTQSVLLPTHTYKNLWITNTTIDTQKMYAVFCSLTYLLDRFIPAHDFRNKVCALYSVYPMIVPGLLNFPHNWRTEKFWKI